MLTPKLKLFFDKLKDEHGKHALERVEAMLKSPLKHRDPAQKDTKYVMPGLTSKPWHSVSDYPEISKIATVLERLHPQIKKEISQVGDKNQILPSYKHYRVSLDNWKALYLYRNNAKTDEGAYLVPTTAKFLQDYLGEMLCPFGEMHFSILKPGVKIPPHSDLWNFTLNLHFAVDIPKGCAIKVADETREWEEGKCLLFDYSYKHEAWNNSEYDRICLLMDIWNPEVTQVEQQALIELITEIRQLIN